VHHDALAEELAPSRDMAKMFRARKLDSLVKTLPATSMELRLAAPLTRDEFFTTGIDNTSDDGYLRGHVSTDFTAAIVV
jgi:hypothetical protein